MTPRMMPEAKRQLSTTIRALRSRLLADLRDAAEGRYRLSVPLEEAGLKEAPRVHRERLEGWLDEQARGEAERGKRGRKREDFLREVEKQAAATLLNRLILLRLLEAARLRPKVVTGGWESPGYRDFRELAPALVRDESEGYGYLLERVFEDLATDLPGLYGPAGVADLIPVPPSTLRHVVEALDDPGLESCWEDDMTLGWVYQYWNDPEREALDEKLDGGGKLEPHEIASKTQMFTERYMVDWLLQNSLGVLWLAQCRKHGWTPEVEADGTLARLEERRIDWRARREAGEVALTELMPLHTEAEERWAYYVPQPIPEEMVREAQDSVRNLKILDPAVGSGHFLVVAFDLLVALYREEARHRGEEGQERWSDRAIVERILEHNLHGIDLDPRAAQITAAALWLKAQRICPAARPRQINLVASNLRLGSLPEDDPALIELRREVERETGIPAAVTDTIIQALKGADHLGSLLKIDAAVETALAQHEEELSRAGAPVQLGIFNEVQPQQQRIPIKKEEARAGLLERLEAFLARHTGGDDLGLRLRGEQLAAGVRFVRMVQVGMYDLVTGNPPYQGSSKMRDAIYVRKEYPRGKADLYAVFLERGVSLASQGGCLAMITMRNWLFIKQFLPLRNWILETFRLALLGDLSWGAFEHMRDNPVAMEVMMRSPALREVSISLMSTNPQQRVRTKEEVDKKRAAILCQGERRDFDLKALRPIDGWPIVHWWDESRRLAYLNSPKLGSLSPAEAGIVTGDDVRFTRRVWEVHVENTLEGRWSFFTMGAKGLSWLEPARFAVNFGRCGTELAAFREVSKSPRFGNPQSYYRRGVAFSMISPEFEARAHRIAGLIGKKGCSLFPCEEDLPNIVCLMNASRTKDLMSSLNPGIGFEISDVNRIAWFQVSDANTIFSTVESAFTEHESHREPSVEFRRPGPSPWRAAQAWAQTAVDRAEDEPLSPYEPELDPEPTTDHLSFALGVALGRFYAESGGILDPETDDLSAALPAGLLFLDGTLAPYEHRDSLGHPAARPLLEVWETHGAEIDVASDLRTWLRLRFFEDVHRQMYESRPIHWPLSSEKRTFVAWINIHRWTADTLRLLQADHLHPALARLEGELTDLRAVRDGADRKAAREAEKRFEKVQRWRDELAAFLANVAQCAEKGPPPTDPRCPPRDADARYDPDLDDGVLINSAALWSLLVPQWKEPQKWWKELASAQGKKDYDWSHLARRYWPGRVDEKCRRDPSLAVAHGCFWKYHPARAWAWELRLQDEIAPDFLIEEGPYDGDGGHEEHRARYLREHPDEARQARKKERQRRERKQRRAQGDLFAEAGADEDGEDGEAEEDEVA